MATPARNNQGVIGRLEALIVSHNNGNFTNYRYTIDDPTDPAAAPLGACCFGIEDYYTYNKTEDNRILDVTTEQAEGAIGNVTTTTPLVKIWTTKLEASQTVKLSANITESTRNSFADSDIQTNNVKVPGVYGAPITYTTNNYYDYLYWTWLLAKGVDGVWSELTQSTTINKTANTTETFKYKSEFIKYLTNSGAKDALHILDNNTLWLFTDTSIHHIDAWGTCGAAPIPRIIYNTAKGRTISSIISSKVLNAYFIKNTTATDYTVEIDFELKKDNTYTENTTIGKTTFVYEHTNTSTPVAGIELEIL